MIVVLPIDHDILIVEAFIIIISLSFILLLLLCKYTCFAHQSKVEAKPWQATLYVGRPHCKFFSSPYLR